MSTSRLARDVALEVWKRDLSQILRVIFRRRVLVLNFALRDEDLKALRDAAGGDLAEAVLRDVGV